MVNEEGTEEVQQYDDVDASSYNISGDSSSPVEESPQQTTESATNSTDNGEISNEQVDPQSEESNEPEEYEFEVDGKVYSMEDIMNWKKDADNKSEWNKSNTQKAQNLSRLGKVFEAIKGDTKLRDYVKDYYYDNDKGYKDSGFGEVEWDNFDLNSETETPQTELPNEILDRLDALESDKEVQILESRLELMEQNYPDLLGGAKTDQFLQFVDEQGIGDLEVGFRLWATDTLLEERNQTRALDENRQRNSGKVIGSHEQGASRVVSNAQPTGQKAYNSMNLDDPEISKYFDN